MSHLVYFHTTTSFLFNFFCLKVRITSLPFQTVANIAAAFCLPCKNLFFRCRLCARSGRTEIFQDDDKLPRRNEAF